MDVAGKTIVVTGATSGIGREVAGRLAAQGARVLIVARDATRAKALAASLPKPATGAHGVFLGDLSRLAEMKRLVAEIAGAEPVVDVLINNAGAIFPTRQVTEDGLERTFALNHLSYFVLTLGLLDRVKAAAAGRIVNTASKVHGIATLDFDDLQTERRYHPYMAYGRSKLGNILFTRALARRLEGTGVTANALHPGFVRTAIGDDDPSFIGRLNKLSKFLAIPLDAGAKTTLHAATSEEGGRLSGAYFVKSRPAKPSAAAQNDAEGERLWTASAQIAAIDA
ncbi:MAG: short-chain dehydrogenase [Phenylobacterium sp.]|nr:short-chain dehydrogenase [Phenylobacterium sp.]